MKCKRTVLPLLGSAFEPGKAAEAISKIEDEELAEIARAEAHYFSTAYLLMPTHFSRFVQPAAVLKLS